MAWPHQTDRLYRRILSALFPPLHPMPPMTATPARRIVDISMHLENDVVSDPPGLGPRINYIDHQMSFADLAQFFPGLQK